MRVANRLLAGVAALGLLAGGLLAGVEIVYGGVRGRPLVVPWDEWYDDARRHDWSSREARVLLSVLLALGVVLLVLQVLRRGPQSLAVTHEGGALTVEANTRSLERALHRAAAGVDGVERATVSLSHHAVQVDVRTSRRDVRGLEAAVRATVDAGLTRAGVGPRPAATTVRVRRTKAAQQAVETASVSAGGATR